MHLCQFATCSTVCMLCDAFQARHIQHACGRCIFYTQSKSIEGTFCKVIFSLWTIAKQFSVRHFMEAERKTINLGSSSSVALEVKDRDKIGLCLLIINQCLRNIDYLFLCLARMKNARDTFPRKGITKALVTCTVLSFVYFLHSQMIRVGLDNRICI